MKKLTLLLLAFVALSCNDPDLTLDQGPDIQTTAVVDADNNAVASNEIFNVVEEQATFPGGMGAWVRHLKENLKYPEQAKREGIEGAVFLSFVVRKDGDISDIQVARGIGGGCDEEAVSLLLDSPNWIPGKQNGEEVNSKMQVRIVFRLSKEERKNAGEAVLIEEIEE